MRKTGFSMSEKESLEVDISITKATEREIAILSDFAGREIIAGPGDTAEIKYTLDIDYLDELKTRLKRVVELMQTEKNKIRVSSTTKMQASVLTIVKYCKEIEKARVK